MLDFSFIFRAADGIKIINQLDDDVFTTVIKYVHKNMSLSDDHADVDDDGGLEKWVDLRWSSARWACNEIHRWTQC